MKKGSSGRGCGKEVSPLSRTCEGLAEAVTTEAVGFRLLALGLFFSAAFVGGRGAFLGDAGGIAVTHRILDATT